MDIAKSNMFCKVQFIEMQAEEIFQKLKGDNYLSLLSRASFIKKIAFYFSEINALHPFREGNGRAQREFIRSLAISQGYSIHFLEGYYTVVVWEQRGAGKSYYTFDEKTNICIDDYIKDMELLCQTLLERYQQDKLYLVGHSWGSVLGLKFAANFPQYLHKYIGCGQVVNMIKSSARALEYAIQKNTENGNQKTVNKLRAIDCKYTGEHWMGDLLFVTKQVVRYGGSLYGKKNYNKFILDFLMSREYTLTDLVRRQKGSYQSIQFLWQELMNINFENNTNYNVPIVFVEGRHDSHVSSKLVDDYFKKINTPKEIYWFERSAHFPQWSEAIKFNDLLITMLTN